MRPDRTARARPRHPAALCVAAIVAAVLVVGCGDDEPLLTTAEYIAAADAACMDSRDAIAELPEPTTEDGVIDYRRGILEIGRDQLAVLEDLSPPEDLQEPHGQVLTALAQQHVLLGGALERIDRGEDARTVTDEIDPEVTALAARTRALARDLDLTVCGTTRLAAATAGGAEDRPWREDYLTAVDGALFFATLLEPAPTLSELAGQDLALDAEADRLEAALERLADRRPPADAERAHDMMVEEVRPLMTAWRAVADAVSTGDEPAYAAARAEAERNRGPVSDLERSLAE